MFRVAAEAFGRHQAAGSGNESRDLIGSKLASFDIFEAARINTHFH